LTADTTGRESIVPAVEEMTASKGLPALGQIPAFPPIAIRLLHLLGDDNVAISEILEPLRADPAFSAEILRRANSSLFGFNSRVSSLQHALVVLGLRRIRVLTITVATGIYLKRVLQIEELRRCWRHTLACALLTEELARACLVHVDLAYTAGLLHDVGRLGLLVARPEEYSQFLRNATAKAAAPEPFDLLDYEKETFGMDHCEVGNCLAAQWKLPQEFAMVTGRHHDRPYGNETDLLALVYLGCQLADTLGFSVVDTGRSLSFDQIREGLPEAARRRWLCDPGVLRERIEDRIKSLDIEGLQMTQVEVQAPPPPVPAPEQPPPAAVQPPPPRRSTLCRDVLTAVITCLVAGTAFFLLCRALSQ
jgi:putative nucleotidyltransferase with HDIG domain